MSDRSIHQADELRPSVRRTSNDVVWSTVRQCLICRGCGEPAIELDGVIYCQNDPECLQALQEEGEERDCAPEGYSYAVMGPDQ